MKRIIFIFFILCAQNIFCQKLNGVFIWKTSGIENDSLVTEINIINDSTYIETDYIGNIKSVDDYKGWKQKIRKGKISKEKKFYKFSEYDNGKLLRSNVVDVKSNRLIFYIVNRSAEKLMKSEMIYVKASL